MVGMAAVAAEAAGAATAAATAAGATGTSHPRNVNDDPGSIEAGVVFVSRAGFQVKFT